MTLEPRWDARLQFAAAGPKEALEVTVWDMDEDKAGKPAREFLGKVCAAFCW